MSETKAYLLWRDLGPEDVYHVACDEDELLQALDDREVDAMTRRRVIERQDGRMKTWLTNQAALRGLRLVRSDCQNIDWDARRAWTSEWVLGNLDRAGNVTQSHIAELAGIAKSQVSFAVCGRRSVSPEVMGRLAVVFADKFELEEGKERDSFINEAMHFGLVPEQSD